MNNDWVVGVQVITTNTEVCYGIQLTVLKHKYSITFCSKKPNKAFTTPLSRIVWVNTISVYKTRLFSAISGQLIRKSHLFFLSCLLDLAEWVLQLRDMRRWNSFERVSFYLYRLTVLKWRGCLENMSLLSKSWFSFPFVSHLLPQTPLNLVWPPEVCGEQQRVSLLQWAHTDRTRRGALPVQTQVRPRNEAKICTYAQNTCKITWAVLPLCWSTGLVTLSSLPWITVRRLWRSPVRTT